MQKPELLGTYRNGTYRVFIYKDGTKVRSSATGKFVPDRPESVDVCISSICSNQCPYCYAGASLDGRWADFQGYPFLKNLPEYLEMNINLNFPVNPDLQNFLEEMAKQHVIVNATVHQNHLYGNYELVKGLLDSDMIHGLGVSYESGTEWGKLGIQDLPGAVVHVIAGVHSVDQIRTLTGHNLKLLILGYKDIGRGEGYRDRFGQTIARNINELRESLPDLRDDFALIAFDNLALEQLRVKEWIPREQWEQIYMGPDAQTSFYVDLVQGAYAPSSLSQDTRPIGEKNLLEMFEDIRKKGEDHAV